jgi:hypothetical protein
MSKFNFYIFTLSIVCYVYHCDKVPSTLPVYQLNLDLPVRERYTKLITDFSQAIINIARAYEQMPIYSDFLETAGQVTKQDSDWMEYVHTVSDITGLTLAEAIMMSVTYELGCTSTIIRDANDQIVFGRNLDFKIPSQMSLGLFQAEYYREGELVYEALEVAGCFGVNTTVKTGQYALSLNLRFSDLKTNLQRVFDGYRSPEYHIMKVMEEADTFGDAVEMLSNYPLTSYAYFTIASQDQGIIITRSRDGVDRVDKLEGDNWFLVITNTDLDQPPDVRRKAAQDRITALGQQDVSFDAVFNILEQPPNNNELTLSTTIQNANGYFNNTLWLNQ